MLAVRITRAGFEEALADACLSHFEAGVHASHDEWRRVLAASPVRVQWDPERTVRLEPLPWRSIQIGLGGPAVHRYVHDWIVGITDITERVHALRGADGSGLPVERPYPLPPSIAARIGASEH